MSTMIVEVYEALKAAGAPEDKAILAAEALSESQTASKSDIARIEREIAVIKWMQGVTLAAVFGIFWLLFKMIA